MVLTPALTPRLWPGTLTGRRCLRFAGPPPPALDYCDECYYYAGEGSSCQRTDSGSLICCAEGEVPCNVSQDQGFESACCPPDYSCTYYIYPKRMPFAKCCPPGTQGCVHGPQGSGVCCTPPQTCQYVEGKNGYCGASCWFSPCS